MNIGGINPNALLVPANANAPSGDASSKIRVLEQKLQLLTKEKEKAVKAKDEDKVKKIEEQIQEIKKQLTELKRQVSKEQDKEENSSSIQTENAKRLGFGRYLNESV